MELELRAKSNVSVLSLDFTFPNLRMESEYSVLVKSSQCSEEGTEDEAERGRAETQGRRKGQTSNHSFHLTRIAHLIVYESFRLIDAGSQGNLAEGSGCR